MKTIKVYSINEVPANYTGMLEWADGSKWWWVNGQFHRLGCPARENADGSKFWYVEDKLHRLDGPAYEDGHCYKEWWVNGKLHRLDGPAKEYAYGYKEWWVDDVKVSKSEYPEAVRLYKLR